MNGLVLTIIGALLAVGVSAVWVYFQKPKLEVRIAPSDDQDYDDDRSAKKARFLRLEVRNKPIHVKLRKWFSRDPAYHCAGALQFLHLESHRQVFSSPARIRWTGTPEPAPYRIRLEGAPILKEQLAPDSARGAFRKTALAVGPSRGLLEDRRVLTWPQRVDVHVGTPVRFDVAAKFDQDSECYVWTQETYRLGWRNSEWKLEEGLYEVVARIDTGGEPCVGRFLLVNTGRRADFRLEPIVSQTRRCGLLRVFARTGLVLLLVGAFIPFFFRVGWEERVPERTKNSGKVLRRTGLIVLREAVAGRLTEEEESEIVARYDDALDAAPEMFRAMREKEVRRISWPARLTDMLGLSIAFAGVLTIALGITSERTKPLPASQPRKPEGE